MWDTAGVHLQSRRNFLNEAIRGNKNIKLFPVLQEYADFLKQHDLENLTKPFAINLNLYSYVSEQ